MRVRKPGGMRVLFVVSAAGLLVFVFGGFLVAFAAMVGCALRDAFRV
jgi:hypothetical protein